MVLTEYLSTITNTWIILQELHRREFWTMLEIPPDMSRLWMGQSVCFYMWKSILGVGSVCLSVSDFPGGFYAELPKFCTAGTPRNSRNHFCRCRNGCCLCMQFKIIDGNGSGICLNCRKNSRRSEGMIQQKSSLGILTWNNADTKALTMERSVTTQAVHNHLVHKIWVPTHPLHVHKGSNQMRWWWCLFFSLFFFKQTIFPYLQLNTTGSYILCSSGWILCWLRWRLHMVMRLMLKRVRHFLCFMSQTSWTNCESSTTALQ